VKRRDILKLAAGAALLPECSAAAGKIDTLVYLMMENRSYDHLLGARKLVEGLPGDGLTAQMSNPDSSGAPVAPFAAPASGLCIPDPPHDWDPAHAQFDGGLNDGFVEAHQAVHPGDVSPMQYLTRLDQPVTWALADAYASSDRWFAAVMGPTWPNRFYWVSGTSTGLKGNGVPGQYAAPTIYGRLDAKGIDYRIYYSDLPFASLMGTADFNLDRHAFSIGQFHRDAAAGKLPHVSYVDPPFLGSDDHPPHHPILGQQFIAAIYDSLAQSPQWDRCLFLVTYDEHGGFFDHVAPPKTDDDLAAEGFDQLGFRVPAILIGPYVKKGYVSSVVRNHASGLKQIENTFGTEPLTARTRAAADLSEMIDLARLARGDAARPAPVPSIDLSQWTIDASCENGGVNLRHDIVRAAVEHPELVARFARR
jgi:phospholipase C